MKSIHWMSPYKYSKIDEIKNSSIASVRLRAGAFLSAMDESRYELTLGETIPEKADVCVIGKIGVYKVEERSAAWMDQIRRQKARGGSLILDYTDDHLAIDSPMAGFYRQCLHHVDWCICSSEVLRESLKKHFPGRTVLIPDAIDIGSKPPKQAASEPITLLWFGHSSNLPYLKNFLPQLEMDRKLNLIILTNTGGIDELKEQGVTSPPNLNVRCAVWSALSMDRTAAMSDMCIIPSNPNDPRKAGVSSNRLITSLAFGLPTAADLLGSYIEYRRYFANLRTQEFVDMLANPIAWRDRVLAAQSEIVGAHSKLNIGKLWQDAISSLLAQPT